MKIKYKIISILGATGSIGTQALEVIDEIAPNTKILFLSAHKNAKLLEEQALKYNPEAVVITDKPSYDEFIANTKYKGKVLFGEEALAEVASDTRNELLISAIVGFAGVVPAYCAIKSGVNLALANKEALVSAGSIIIAEAKKQGREIIPIDSEHSAVYQCLAGENRDNIEKIILTASGGPFRTWSADRFKDIQLSDALKHPNWDMGNKITIDSATMMNKGFEVIEAVWLFGVEAQKIDVLVHPQSIIHSLVQFRDGSQKAQLGLPDMKLPIAYAITAPDRKLLSSERLNLSQVGSLTFEEPDTKRFPCLALAYNALARGGNACAVLNAANDTAVSLFLEEKIRYIDIPKAIDYALGKIAYIAQPGINDILDTINETKALILSINKF